MTQRFREQPKLRLLIGGILTALVWVLYVIRVMLGVGPMRDNEGHQAPALHYLIGALTVTGMAAVWIGLRALMERRQKPPK